MTVPWGSWPAPVGGSGGGSGGGGTADALATTGAPVDVSGGAPPELGQVLMAIDDTHAEWKVPGLHYDPAIRFNMDLSGQATIEPGTWGFVQTLPVGFEGDPQIFVVSSLSAPPVDSRFGLYLAVALDRPVEVQLLGASLIFGLDGVLAPTCVLFPGAFYEWVFYHEAGSAIWGLVSDTARMAQRFEAPWLALSDPNKTVFPITKASSEPANGSALIYRNVGASPTAAWELPELAGDAQHGLRGAGTLHALATTGIAGFQSASDKTKLDGIESGAQVVTFGRVQTALASATSSVALNAQRITGVADPTGAQDVATKNYIDTSVWKTPVRAAAGTNITTSGLQTVDTVPLANGDRVLLCGQSVTTANGIYVCNSAGAWPRATDADTSAKLRSGVMIPVTDGNSADTLFTLATNDPIVLGTTALTFQQLMRAVTSAANISGLSGVGSGGSSRWAPIDHVHSIEALDAACNNFRLSNNNTSSVPTNASSSTIYVMPHTGGRIALFLTNWQYYQPTGVSSIAITGQTAGIPCDVFAVAGGSLTPTGVTLELSPWLNASTRSTTLAQQNGVWIKASSTTKRYLGTFLPDSATTFAHASTGSDTTFPICGLWNQDNRIRGGFTWTPTFDTWAIPSANTWQSINAQASAKVQYVQGQSIDVVSAEHIGAASGSSGGSLGIGVDSTSSPTGLRDFAANNGAGALRARLKQNIAAGAHNLNALANGGATSVTFYGAHAPMQGGIAADLYF